MRLRTLSMLSFSLLLAAPAAYAQVATPATQGQPAPAASAPRRPASPRGMVATQVGGAWAVMKEGEAPRYQNGKWIEIAYGRPILRGRANIFGSGADYGKTLSDDGPVWRAGANQTTRLMTEAPLAFGDTVVPPGEYSVFVDLKPTGWTLILSKQAAQEKYDPNEKVAVWGSYNYDAKYDVARIPMKVEMTPTSLDQFTIAFVNMTQQGGTLALWWDTQRATCDFKVAQ